MKFITAFKMKIIAPILIFTTLLIFFWQCSSKRSIENNHVKSSLVINQGDSAFVNLFVLEKNGNLSKESQSVKSKVGIWKEYYLNGKIKSIGKYDNKVIKTFDTTYQVYTEVGAVTTMYDVKLYSPKDSTWQYFDEQGDLIKSEYYDKGKLLHENVISSIYSVEPQRIFYKNYFLVEEYDKNYNYTVSYYKYSGAISYEKATKENLIKKLYFDKDGVFLKIEK